VGFWGIIGDNAAVLRRVRGR